MYLIAGQDEILSKSEEIVDTHLKTEVANE